eukprot:scaffold17342_cov130-Isochrysis_galbana.AAC.7
MMKEIDGLHQSGTIAEGVPEDSLPSWDAARGRATEVVDGLWVLVRKRGADGAVERYKARWMDLG